MAKSNTRGATVSKLSDLRDIRKMKGDERIHLGSFSGGAEVQLYNGVYLLYEVPEYGGEPMYVGPYKDSQVMEMIEVIHGWT